MDGRAVLAEGVAEVDWRVSRARSGAPTLALGRRGVHSAYDPEREARSHARRMLAAMAVRGADTPTLVGVGLGYLPNALVEAGARHVLAWEPFPALAAALPARAPAEGVRVAASAAAFEAALDEVVAAGGRPHLEVHPGYGDVCRFEARLAARALQRCLGHAGRRDPSRAVVSRRSLDALVRLPARGTLEDWSGSCRGQTAVVVAPGPSLAEALPVLARRRGGAIFAALQALRPLNEAGVVPDFVVAPDPLTWEPFVSGFTPRFGALLADTAAPPPLVDRWPERTYLFHLRGPQLEGLAWEACGLPTLDEPVATVSETALLLARRFGARELALVGMDFLQTDPGRYKIHFRTRDMDDGVVATNSHYFHGARFASHACARWSAAGARIWRTGRGLPVRGAQRIDPEGLATRLDAAPPFRPGAPAWAGCEIRRREAAALLAAVARRPAEGPHAGEFALPIDYRWDDLRPLPPREQSAACQRALRALEPRERRRRDEPRERRPRDEPRA